MPTVQNQIDAINTRIGEVVKPNSIVSVAALPTSAKVMIIDPAGADGAINQVDASVIVAQGQKVPFDDFGTIAEFLTDQVNQLKGFSVFDENNSIIYVYKGVANGLITDYWQLGTGTGQLEKITENSKTGFIIKGDNRANKGEIGNRAVDLSASTSASTTKGSTGDDTHTTGVDNINSGSFGDVEGFLNTNSGSIAHVEGRNNINSGSIAHVEGQTNINTSSAAHVEGNNNTNSGLIAHVEGSSNLNSGSYAHVQGRSNFGRSEGEHSGGAFGTDYTYTNSITDRLVNHGNGANTSARSDAYTLFKNGAQKLFFAALSTITNAVKGFVMLDENAVMHIHDGTSFKEVAFAGAGGGASYIQMYNQMKWTLPANGNFAGMGDGTSYTNGDPTTDSTESIAVDYVANSIAVIIGYSDFAYKLEQIRVASNTMLNASACQLVVGYRDIRDGVTFNVNSSNPVVLSTETLSKPGAHATGFTKLVTFATPLDIPANKEIVIGLKATSLDSASTVSLWHCATTLTLKKV